MLHLCGAKNQAGGSFTVAICWQAGTDHSVLFLWPCAIVWTSFPILMKPFNSRGSFRDDYVVHTQPSHSITFVWNPVGGSQK